MASCINKYQRNTTMSLFKSLFDAHYALTTTALANTAKAMHKPTITSKESMTAYAKATNQYGKKATFNTVDSANTSMVIEYC